MNCPFCDSKNIEKNMLIDADLACVIMNLYPATPGHMLIVPKIHIGTFSELSHVCCCEMIMLAHKVMHMVKIWLRPDGLNVFWNEGEIAGQSLEHMHMHIVPRYINDDLRNFERKNGKYVMLSDADRLEFRRIMSMQDDR